MDSPLSSGLFSTMKSVKAMKNTCSCSGSSRALNTKMNKYMIVGGSRAPFSQLGEDCFADVNPKGR